jgi:hypothetical protein
MPKNSRAQTHSERKRLNEDGLQLGEPPAKKGTGSLATCRDASETGNNLIKSRH